MDLRYPLILDGGLATELERTFNKDLSGACTKAARQGETNGRLIQLGRLWSAHCLDQDPDAIKAVHRSYFEAGADVATTASYQASVRGFLDAGYSRDEAEKLMRRSVQLAREARDEYGQGWVALSMGCYGAILANGAEYTGDYGKDIGVDDLVTFHRERLEICLQEPGVDFLLFETIPSFLEVQAIRQLVKDQNLPPIAVSFSCRSSKHISDGTPLEAAVDTLANLDRVFAIGVNCTKPKYIPPLLNILLNEKNEKTILLYPDGGEEWNAITRSWKSETKVPTDIFGASMAEWATLVSEAGRNVILGGCCGTGPTHIRACRKALTT